MSMKQFRKTTLTFAIAATSLAAQWAPADFIEDSTLNGKVRTVYYNVEKYNRVDINDINHPKTQPSYGGAWTGSVAVDLKSGYWNDILGFDTSVYSVSKLYMAEKNGNNSKELLNDNKEGFSKFGQAFIKFKHGDEVINAQLNAGRQIIYNALISSSTSRSVPSSWQGYNFNSNINGVHIGMAYVDKMSLRNKAGFHKLENFDNEHIDYIAGAQIDTTLENIALMYRNAYSKDFLQAHNLKVAYTFEPKNHISLTLDASYFITKKNGDLWTGYTNWKEPVTNNVYNPADAAFDNKAQNTTLNAKLVITDWSLFASAGYTSAKSSHTLGHYYYDFGKNTHGMFDAPTTGFGEDFLYHNETAWTTGFLYDFATLGAPGLNAGYSLHYGSGMRANNGHKASEHEHDIYVQYAFLQPALKGLKFKLTYAIYENDKALRETIGFGKKNDLRAWVDYQLAAF